MGSLMQLIKLLGSLPQLAAIIPLLTQLVTLIKSGASFDKILPVILQIVALFVPVPGPGPTPVPPSPTPGPNPVFASAAEEGDVVSEAVAAGVPESDIRALVEAVK